MKLSGLRRVSFLLAMVYTVSTIRTRRHGCICGDSKSDLNICGCGPSVSGVVVKAANLQKLSPVHIPLSRGKPYKFDCRCPHCSGFLGSSGSSRTSFGTWKYGHNRFHQLFNKFRPIHSSYPGSLLSQRRFPNIFGTPGFVLPFASNQPLYPTFGGNVGFGCPYSALSPYYGNSGPFNLGPQILPLSSIKSDEFNTQGCDCCNMHSPHYELNSFALENDEYPTNDDFCLCTKKAVPEKKSFLNSKEYKKSSVFENAFEDKLAYGPSRIPLDDMEKNKAFKIPEKNLHMVEEPIMEPKSLTDHFAQDEFKSCRCQGESEKQTKLETILEGRKTEFKLRNKARKNEPLEYINRCEKCGMKNFDLSPPIGSKISENENLPSSHYIKPIKNFQPINEFSAPMLQSDKMINPCYHYENGCDEENDDYSEDFRILESTGNCRCENEDCSPRSKISERLKSNYENARILHLEHLTCHR